jgi:MFS transporter, SP family, major inositol transporter
VTVGIVTSSLLIGAVFGAFIGGKLADKFGRKMTLIILSVCPLLVIYSFPYQQIFFIIGTIGSSLAPNIFVNTIHFYFNILP